MLKTSRVLSSVVLVFAFVLLGGSLNGQTLPAVQRKVLLQHDLVIPGYQTVLVAVGIPVGGREGLHTHPGSVLVYVEEGELTLDYEGKPSMTYKPGESFYVEPGKVHEGINRGKVPVKALATFVVEKDKPMVTQVKK